MQAAPIAGAMWLLVASVPDIASMAQRRALLRLAEWREAGTFASAPALRSGRHVLVTIPDLHLEHDGLDREAEAVFRERPEVVVFLSKHRSESRSPSLTVHPIGNLGPAEFGGRLRTVVPAAPHVMTAALRAVRREAGGLPYSVTFEATHHGPYLETPAFFIEAGSTEAEWGDDGAAEALMRALLSADPRPSRVGIGVGGGHYVPRHTDVALARDVAFAHLVDGYAIPRLDDAMVSHLVERSSGASFVYFHRKAIDKPVLRALEARFFAHGLEVLREDDLPPRSPEQSY